MIFFGLVTTVAVLINRYLWTRLVRDTRLSPAISRAATLILIALAGSLPLTVLSWVLISRASSPLMTLVAFGWLGVAFYLVLLLAAWDVLRASIWLAAGVGRLARRQTSASAGERKREPEAPGQSEPDAHPSASLPKPQPLAAVPNPQPLAAVPNPQPLAAVPNPQPLAAGLETRRVFVARAAAAGALVAAGGVGVFGVRSAFYDITLPEVPVVLERFPRALDGYTIALLTDVHIGPMLDGRFLRQLAEQINRARPDLIAIGGDLVDGRVAQIGAQVAELRRLRARDGVHFVTGNHEYYSRAREWIAFLQRLGVNVLMNQHVTIGAAADGGKSRATFDLAGIPDHYAGHAGGIAPDAELAIAGRDDQRELVMLAHQPVQIREVAAVGAGLQLSGHTHGGQLFPFGELTRLAQPYIAGLHRHAPTTTQIYVSRGTGFWGPPMRVLAPAEVALLRLHAG